MNNSSTIKYKAVIILAMLLCALGVNAQREKNNIYLFDCTGSMKTNGLWQPAKEALNATIDTQSTIPGSQFTIIPFGDSPYSYFVFGSTDYKNKKSDINNAFDKYIEEAKYTRITDVLNSGFSRCDENKENKIYLLTDGMPNGGDTPEKVAKAISDWCGSHRNCRLFYVALTDGVINPIIQSAIDRCPDAFIVQCEDKIIPQIADIASEVYTNLEELQDWREISFSIPGDYQIKATANDELFDVNIKDNKTSEGTIKLNKVDALRRNHQLITSALSEGYPVGISLRVYDNLGNTGAFVAHPDDTPEAKEDGWHAMVIVGYSEENNFYIVRNSWGKGFGEDGYCYISSAYIDDPKYLDFACIITEITDSTEGMLGDIPDLLADFAATETEIRIAAIRNAIAKVRIELDNKKSLYAEYYKYYQKLLLHLTMPNTQSKILSLAEKAYQSSQTTVSEINEVTLENSIIDKKKGKAQSLKYAIAALFTIAVCCGIAAYFTVGIVLLIIAAACGGLGLVLLGCYKWQFSKKSGDFQNNTNAPIVNSALHKDDLLELQMKYHIAGMWIDCFHKLSIEIGKVYDRLSSYNDTLRAWQRSYFDKVRHPTASEGQMFRTLDSVALPDQLFEANKEEIVRKIDLLRVFESYKANVDDLNNSLENLRGEVRNSIDSIIGDFSIANYLLGDNYPYLDSVDLQKELSALLAVGQPSYRNRVMNATPPVRMVMANVEPKRTAMWESNIISGFPPHPIQLPLIDKSMMLLLTLHPLADEL